MKLSFWEGEVDAAMVKGVVRLLEALVVRFVQCPETSVAEVLGSL